MDIPDFLSLGRSIGFDFNPDGIVPELDLQAGRIPSERGVAVCLPAVVPLVSAQDCSNWSNEDLRGTYTLAGSLVACSLSWAHRSVVALSTADGRLCHLGIPSHLVPDLPDFRALKGEW